MYAVVDAGEDTGRVDGAPTALEPLPIVLRCDSRLRAKVRYTLDTLFMAGGIPVVYVPEVPSGDRPWIFYGPEGAAQRSPHCLWLLHVPDAWRFLTGAYEPYCRDVGNGLIVLFPTEEPVPRARNHIPFDLAANAFYCLSCWSERRERRTTSTRRLYEGSIYDRLQVPQDVVDRYLDFLMERLRRTAGTRSGLEPPAARWPGGHAWALVLSHDVDFLSSSIRETLTQGVRTLGRHLIRQRDPGAAARGVWALFNGMLRGRDVFDDLSGIMATERARGASSSFQIAVARTHPNDVNYDLMDDRVRDRLSEIPAQGFDLCLHGSYRSTSSGEAYDREVEILAKRLGRPLGSRQHFLSFDFDVLFRAQERAGIEYDMSLGYPDRTGPRTGFSYPIFPYCLDEDRPYDVVEIGLFLMDVTLRSYMGLRDAAARAEVDATVERLCHRGGCGSVVWHPIVFGGARDPGFGELFWHLVDRVTETGGLATDGRTINRFWRATARRYESFRHIRSADEARVGASGPR